MSANAPTFAAVLTPRAPGAIAVVGVAGADPARIVSSLIELRGGGDAGRMAKDAPRLVRLRDAGIILDEAIVTTFAIRDGHRIEICTHGGMRVVQRVVEALERRGATRLAECDFEDRFGVRDPLQRDVEKALIRAGSRKLALWLLAQGRLLPTYWANGESRRTDADRAAFQTRSQAGIRMVRGIRIALVGPPNAGKSTLANRLIGHGRVIVSDEAGTTRDWIDETAMIDGWPVTLTDTAGIRSTTCEIEVEAIRRGSAQARSSDLVLVIVDGRDSESIRIASIADATAAVGDRTPKLVVANKMDAVIGGMDAGATAGQIGISALSGSGVDQLEHRIGEILGFGLLDRKLATGFLPGHLDGRAETLSERSAT